MSDKAKTIQVFGTGCPTCKRLFESTKQAVKELGLDVAVEYVTDIQRMLSLGVMSSPVLAIDGQVVVSGQAPNVEKIKELINKNQASATIDGESSGCSCGGQC